jgi:hypothetical protein
VYQILSTGAQTLAPPSIHPESGEEVVWLDPNVEPRNIDKVELLHRVGVEAFCMAVRHFWPAIGSRNEAAMALARVLLEALATRISNEEERIAIVDELVVAVAMSGGDGEASRNGKERARATLEKMNAGEETIGLTRLVELLELPEATIKTFRKWLGISITLGVNAADPHVAKLNENYALVIVGDKVAVMNTSGSEIKLLTVSAFDQWHANQYVTYTDKAGDERKMSLAKHWMHHPLRRQFEGITFAPNQEVTNYYNLWRGFAVEQRRGNCSKFLAHLKDNVCCKDDGLFRWVSGWFAQIVQRPEEKPGTSLVLRGKMGVGKTFVGWVMGKILGNHYVRVADPRYVTGRFNSHLTSCLLLHCDEAFWAGDHTAEGKLKDLITGDYQYIELKGKEAIRLPNYVRLLVTGNPDWIVPVGFEERRFAMLDVGEEHMQDIQYFEAITEELDNGGAEALLDYLSNFDLRSVDLKTIPITAALLDQKFSSLSPEYGWWIDTLARGELPYGIGEVGKCPASRLFDRYIRHASKQGVRRRSIEVQIGVFLNKNVPGLIKADGTYGVGPGTGPLAQRGYIYVFPPLAVCRRVFAEKMRQPIAWPQKEEWTTSPILDPEEEPF